MKWHQPEKDGKKDGKKELYYQSDTGHRIACCRLRGVWGYLLYSPKREFIGLFTKPEDARRAAE
jgi:hypothetical protein